MQGFMTAIVITASIVGAFILLLLIYYIVAFFRIGTFKDAVVYSVNNETFCQDDEGPCRLVLQNVARPPIQQEYSNDMALYCSDLISRVSLLFRDKYGTDTLELPFSLTLHQTLYYDDNIFGFVGVDEDDVYWIAFRGTSTSEEWTKDFQHSQELFDTNQAEQKVFGQQMCHTGFIDIFEEMNINIPEGSPVCCDRT